VEGSAVGNGGVVVVYREGGADWVHFSGGLGREEGSGAW